mmetsp:Transcript_54536/g.111254  ORF Transcript_54536/g.111254 Transcript_54536/m.111254 type:complete len:188 (-) Transcript_54536:97-660(-)
MGRSALLQAIREEEEHKDTGPELVTRLRKWRVVERRWKKQGVVKHPGGNQSGRGGKKQSASSRSLPPRQQQLRRLCKSRTSDSQRFCRGWLGKRRRRLRTEWVPFYWAGGVTSHSYAVSSHSCAKQVSGSVRAWTSSCSTSPVTSLPSRATQSGTAFQEGNKRYCTSRIVGRRPFDRGGWLGVGVPV